MASPLAAVHRRVAAFAWDRPTAAGIIVAALVAIAAAGIAELRIDFSSRSFYGGDHEAIRTLQEFQERWGPDDDVVVVVVEAADGDLLTRERIEAIGAVAADIASLPDVRAALSIANQRIPPPGGTMDDARPLWELPGFDPSGPVTREQVLARLPFVPLLLSVDGRSAAIVARLGFSSDDLERTIPAVARIDAIARAANGRAGLRLGVAGVPAVRAGFIALTTRDQLRLIPLALALMALALYWVFGRWHGVIVPGLSAVVPLALLLGLMGWTGEPIGLLNQVYFTLIPVLAVADAIHLLARYHEERRRRPPREAMLAAVEHVGLACTFTMLTTVAAFLSLGLGGTPMLTRFGVFAAAGLVMAWALVFVLPPLALRLSPGPLVPARTSEWLINIGRVVVRHPVRVIVITAVCTVVAVVLGQRVQVDNHLSTLLRPDHPVRQAGAVLDRSLGGTLSLELELRGPAGVLVEPWVVNALASFEDWAAARPHVRAVIGPGRSLEAVSDATGTLLDSPADIREVLDRLGAFIDRSEVVSTDERFARVSIRVGDPGGRAFQALADEVLAEARAVFEPFGLTPVLSGTTLVAYAGVNHIAESLRVSLLSIFDAVVIVFLVVFRSPRVAFIALVPNTLPLVAGYGSLAIFGIDLDPLSAVILAFGLGIAADDTLHLLARMREDLRNGATLEQAIGLAIEHSGRAVVVASVVLSGGLAVNLLSSFPPLQLLGALGAFVMLVAVACDLVLLPALLVALRAGRALRGRT